MELVIMAGGMGSRFGGLKQIEPIDANGNFIIDYSIFDAIRCGFTKVIFIIKEENFEIFKETIGKRIEKIIKTEYVFQDNSNIPSKYNIPTNRTKPFGTGHAVLCAKKAITSNFLVINADDFYGYDAFLTASKFLQGNKDNSTYALIGYMAGNTITESGSVKRGVCKSQNGYLQSITESSIEKISNNQLVATALESNTAPNIIDNNTIVSMNMFAFSKEFINYLDECFLKFLEANKTDLSSVEYFLPTVVSKLIQQNLVKVKVLPTQAKWYGITYKQDKELVENSIKKLISSKIYPDNLWK